MRRNIAIVWVALLAGCSLAPKFERPESETPAQFKELTPAERGNWKTAQPAESQPPGEWWKVFADPVLDAFEADAIAANQNLKAAVARVSQARALVGVAKADRIPRVDAGFGPSREKPQGRGRARPSAPPARACPRGIARQAARGVQPGSCSAGGRDARVSRRPALVAARTPAGYRGGKPHHGGGKLAHRSCKGSLLSGAEPHGSGWF